MDNKIVGASPRSGQEQEQFAIQRQEAAQRVAMRHAHTIVRVHVAEWPTVAEAREQGRALGTKDIHTATFILGPGEQFSSSFVHEEGLAITTTQGQMLNGDAAMTPEAFENLVNAELGLDRPQDRENDDA